MKADDLQMENKFSPTEVSTSKAVVTANSINMAILLPLIFILK